MSGEASDFGAQNFGRAVTRRILKSIHLAELTQARLKELLNYDPETGIFTWRVNRQGICKGRNAGCLHNKGGRTYRAIKIDGVARGAHRLAFLYIYGYMPSVVDHVDNSPLNNRIGNLRAATPAQNSANSKLSKKNSSGYKGVSLRKRSKKWTSQISAVGHYKHLGSFFTPEEAHEAYRRAAIERSGDFARFT